MARSKEEIERWFREVLCSRAHNPKPREVVVVSMKYKHGFVIKPYGGEDYES